MSDPTVEIAAGALRGVAEDGVLAFKGVPYGAPTGGANRFRPPQRAEPWSGVRDATGYGATAPQPPPPPARLDKAPEPDAAEECLALNVWTSGTGGAEKPVLVWFHGGGFSTGSGSRPSYAGAALARRDDCVVLTVNHRLGLLGFLDLGAIAGDEYLDAGNAGMLDLVAALEWVRDNIEAFGGDPSRVTIFGESGGGGKVASMLAMPPAEGLFHRAAIQSGVFLGGPGELGQTRERAEPIAAGVLERLGGLDGLLAAPVERILEVQREIELAHRPGSGGVMPFCPLVDGRSLADHPRAAVAAGASADIPLIIGSNLHESTFFLWLADPSYREQGRAWSPDDEQLVERLGGYACGQAAELVDAYRKLRPDESNGDLYVAISSDNMRVGAIRWAEAKAAGGRASVHTYLFALESPAVGGALRAAHGNEIPFVFDTTEHRVATRGGPRSLVEAMSGAWVSFAATGAPEIPGLGAWPAYTAERRETVVFDEPSEVVADPHGDERRAWDAVV